MSKALYVSPDRIYLNSRGEPCGSKDPDKQRLLVAAGGSLPMEDARRYGLVPAEAQAEQDAPPIKVAIHMPDRSQIALSVSEVDDLIRAADIEAAVEEPEEPEEPEEAAEELKAPAKAGSTPGRKKKKK